MEHKQAIAALVVCLGAILWSPVVLLASGAGGHTYPNQKLTPGVIDPKLTADVICRKGWSTNRVRNVDLTTKRQVYKGYGMNSKAKPCPCEVDHLISLELGGSNDIHNLWPQPYSGPLNARDKDGLENALHDLVCHGDVSLAVAQRKISTDWVAARKEYMDK